MENGKWVTSFFQNRKPSVTVNDEISEKVDIISGIPQGSVMGPLLFLIYIGNISEDNGCLVYVDDVKSA